MSTDAGPDRLSIVVFSPGFDKVHYALVMAAAAAATDTPATLFFTMEAIRALEKPADDGTPAWRQMPAGPAAVAAGGEMDDDFQARGVATFEELLQSCVALKVRFMVCEMGLRALGLEKEALRGDVPVEAGGVVTFLKDASPDGATFFI
tara:strand:+ start:645 stop:1091 length:447 start_codon:yes stop_codon:yes gene_type:complete